MSNTIPQNLEIRTDAKGNRLCGFENCSNRYHGNGLCTGHNFQVSEGRPLKPLNKNVRGRTCLFPGCEKRYKGRGYCPGHLYQLRAGKELVPLKSYPVKPKRLCSFPGCDNVHDARGYCNPHNAQISRGKELTPLKKYRLLKDEFPCFYNEIDWQATLEDTPNVDKDNLAVFSRNKVHWICPKGHRWSCEVKDRTHPQKQVGCPACNKSQTSIQEKDFRAAMVGSGRMVTMPFTGVSLNDVYFGPRRLTLDVISFDKVSSRKVYADYDGGYFHSLEGSEDRDIRKTNLILDYDDEAIVVRVRAGCPALPMEHPRLIQIMTEGVPIYAEIVQEIETRLNDM